MLTIQNLVKSYGSQVLFQNTTFSIGNQSRVGCIGPNGSGKSTFFRILIGQEHADHGEVLFPRFYRIACMQQEWTPHEEDTVLEAALREHKDWYKANQDLISFSTSLDHQSNDYHEAETQFLALGGYAVQQQAKELLAGLGFSEQAMVSPAKDLSGGWRIRCHIAGVLLQQADLLLLDEPTNHLDVETVVWLESFLLAYPKSIMLISHDHRLISRISTDILEFAPPKLTFWPGSLVQYERQKNERMEHIQAEIANKEKEIDRLMQFVNKFRAKATKARQAQNRLKTSSHYEEELQKLKQSMPIVSQRPSRFHLPLKERLPRTVIEIQNAQFGYDPNRVLFSLDKCVIESGKKIGIVGVNGVGKTTFLRSCAGEIPLLQGQVKIPEQMKIGYFAQHCMEQLPLQISVFDYLYNSTFGNTIADVRTVAASLGLMANDMDKNISVLSGGEKARTTLAQIILSRPGLLLLDEPTNHLDLEACEVLVKGLSDFEGTVLVVSHDRDFLDTLVHYVLEIQVGKAYLHHGNYSDWSRRKGKNDFIEVTVNNKSTPSVNRKQQRQQDSFMRQQQAKEKRNIQKHCDEVEKRLELCKNERILLEKNLCDPERVRDPEFVTWVKRHSYLGLRIEALEEEWLQLAEQLDYTLNRK